MAESMQPGTGAPAQQPYGYQPQPQYQQQYPQQYGPAPMPMNIEGLLRKLVLVMLILVGVLLMFIGRIIELYATANVREGILIATLGAFMVAAVALVWAIASKRTTNYQNLGLFILAAMLLSFFGFMMSVSLGAVLP